MKFKFLTYVICVFGIILVFKMWHQQISTYWQTKTSVKKDPNMKCVLQWTSPYTEPFVYMGQGQETFIMRKCSNTNCFITADRHLLSDITEFDVILFHGPELKYNRSKFQIGPHKRAANQIYIFASMESSAYYPAKDDTYNNFFNLTWTYKLDSDIFYGYVTTRNKDGEIIGPKADMHWIDIKNMLPINDIVKAKLAHKKLDAAWFVSNCEAISKRTKYVENLRRELDKYHMSIDIYGKCGTKNCPRHSMDKCLELIKKDYHFYLALENSFSDDYVTEKLLHALHNYAVPVVYGGADYTRFMPEGIYLNAAELDAKNLAHEMFQIITDKGRYLNFFKWHNHYSYHSPEESPETDVYCNFCNYINKIEFSNKKMTVDNFKDWWNGNL